MGKYDGDALRKFRLSGKILRETREEMKRFVREGMPIIEICEKAEKLIREKGGNPAFPCNVSINETAAHYTSPPNDEKRIPEKSLVKVDIGVHVDGYVTDTAFTACFNPEYEILVETTMEDNELNRAKMAQFVAQEIIMDGKIPHATKEAVFALVQESNRRAKEIDNKNHALSLRLREMGGLIRAAGDIATIDKEEFIESKHIKLAMKRSKTIEDQIKERHGSYYAGLSTDITGSQKEMSPYHFWNRYPYDDKTGYE